jgi:PilZ domain
MNSDGPAPRRERRRSSRVQASIPAELTGTQSFPTRGEVTDISMLGCYFATPAPLAMGSVVTIKLTILAQKWLAKGMIRTCDPGVGNGIEFTQMDRASKEQLETYLRTAPKQAPGF